MGGSAEELTPRRLFEVCGLEEALRIDEEAGGKGLWWGCVR